MQVTFAKFASKTKAKLLLNLVTMEVCVENVENLSFLVKDNVTYAEAYILIKWKSKYLEF